MGREERMNWEIGIDIHTMSVCMLSLLCSTLCNPMDCSPSGSSVCGSLQARILEWVDMRSSSYIHTAMYEIDNK